MAKWPRCGRKRESETAVKAAYGGLSCCDGLCNLMSHFLLTPILGHNGFDDVSRAYLQRGEHGKQTCKRPERTQLNL